MTIRWKIALLGLPIPCLLGAQFPDSTATKCEAPQWSTPQFLTDSITPPIGITSASIADNPSGGVYILGRGPYIETDTGLYMKEPFVAFHVSSKGHPTRLSTPSFAGDFAMPRGGVVNDTLHIFWGEADSTATVPAPRDRYADYVPIVAGIWTAHYANKTWSRPTFVTGRVNTNWYLTTGWARSDWSPAVNLAIVGIRATGGWSMSWLNASSAAPPADVDLGVVPLYSMLMSPAPSHLLFGYIANDPSVPNDRNSVFVIRSTNVGQSWSAPVRIALSGQELARDILLVSTPNGKLHAIWVRNTSGETFGGQLVGYSVSQDTGKTWSAPEYWNPGTTLRNLKAVSDTHNTIHLVYQSSLPDGWPGLMYTSRAMTSSSWESPTRMFGDTMSGRMPQLTRTASGDLLVLFEQRLNRTGNLGTFGSAISYLHPLRACQPKP